MVIVNMYREIFNLFNFLPGNNIYICIIFPPIYKILVLIDVGGGGKRKLVQEVERAIREAKQG